MLLGNLIGWEIVD